MNRALLVIKRTFDDDVVVTPTETKELISYEFKSREGNSDAISIGDGYHTMDELYEHRHALFLALVKYFDNYITPLASNIKCWKSLKHDDGSFFEGWFILGMTKTTRAFQEGMPSEKSDISYHLPMKYWHMAKVIELEKAPPYTGYTSQDVIKRLLEL